MHKLLKRPAFRFNSLFFSTKTNPKTENISHLFPIGYAGIFALRTIFILSVFRETIKKKENMYNPLKEIKSPVPSDIEISQSVQPIPIAKLAESIGIKPEEFSQYGSDAGKVKLSVLDRLKDEPNGNYVLVTGITPTPLGEGKSTTLLGISQAIGAHLNKKVFSNVRQPSQGPTFGIKGGAHGGGYAQVVPMEAFNLHLTGDIHAITASNNLLAAAIDTRMFHESYLKDESLYNYLCPIKKDGKRAPFTPTMLTRLKKLGIKETDPEKLTTEERVKFSRLNIDPDSITWKRVVDTNDRLLRKITIGQGVAEKNRTRTTGFEITVASELMAILALTTSLKDMRERIGRIVCCSDKDGKPITAEDIGCAGAMTVMMKDAIEPTLMQTLEGTPVFVHAGPFANIAHGNSSIVADQIALKLVGKDGYVLTEAGFGADIGAEKFFNIKCRYSGLQPDCAVIVVSIRALKMHGGCKLEQTNIENLEAVEKGSENMMKHIENLKSFGIPVIACINHFSADTDKEIEIVKKKAMEAGAFAAVVSKHWAEGGRGAIECAKAIEEACKQSKQFKFLYSLEESIKEKIEKVCKNIYGAKSVDYTEQAEKSIETITKQGFANLPVCMAKTQYSFSHDPKLLNVPKDFVVVVRDVKASVGAGMIVVYLGEISTMPGLPVRAGYFGIDIDLETGKVIGLY